MVPNRDQFDLFCRVNVQTEMAHSDFVSFIAQRVGGGSRMNSIKSDKLDISVDDNDVFDAEKSRTGKDRWLFFRYTLEIDPVAGIAPETYVAAIGELLKSLWSAGMDAVAASEFEEKLPRNVRRLKWAKTPPDSGDVVRIEMIDETHIVLPAPSDLAAPDACVHPGSKNDSL